MNFRGFGGIVPLYTSFLKRSKIVREIGRVFKPTKNKATVITVIKSIENASKVDDNCSFFDFLDPLYWIKSSLYYLIPGNITYILVGALMLFCLYLFLFKNNKHTTLFRVGGVYSILSKIALFGSGCVLFSQNLVGIIITTISFISLFIFNADLIELSSILSLGSICFNISYCFLNIFLSTFKPTKTH